MELPTVRVDASLRRLAFVNHGRPGQALSGDVAALLTGIAKAGLVVESQSAFSACRVLRLAVNFPFRILGIFIFRLQLQGYSIDSRACAAQPASR